MSRKNLFLLTVLVSLCTGANPLRAAETLPLAGEWRFALDRTDAGTNGQWFAKDLPDKIQLPGILQAQGYGDDISPTTPWVLTLGDAWWKIQPASLREHFSQPGQVEVPFLSQPPKHYLGAAWYQRDIEIPADHRDRHFTLFLERAHWKTTVWVDDKEFPSNDSLGAPHITDLGVLTPGKHRLSIRVDNRAQLPAQGHLVDSHAVSDSLGATWNGIVGKIELQNTPQVWIEDVQVFPHAETKSITVKGILGNSTEMSVTNEIVLNFMPITADVARSQQILQVISSSRWTQFEVEVKNEYPIKTWDEFNRELFELTVTKRTQSLLDRTKWDRRKVIFGFREITANDKELLINGRPVNLRLAHSGGDFPLTGHPAMDVASWKKIIQSCKDYGLNGIRFHSWCPPEAAFEAADELGFYLQPECGLWADFSNQPTRDWLYAETERMLKAYGNHPSFILLAPSNEPRNYARVTPQWAVTNYAKDDRR
ncbi:MAG: sugar-binding domain-containing protein, partial [Verrucomicrobiota bacterium]